MKLRYLILGLAVVFDAGAQTASRSTLVASIDSIAQAALKDGPVPGMSVAVVRGSDTLLAKGYGLADLENDVPATPLTVYRIGSITKQFTAAAIMQLAEQGKLSLDDELTKFFPEYPVRGNKVTIRHLLNHTSGIRSYTGLGPKWMSRLRLDYSTDSMIALFRDEPFDFAPGSQWRYNNSGYFLLGVIIQKVSGKPYETYVSEHFFKPLGMTGSLYCEHKPIIKHRSQGYQLKDDTFLNADMMSMTHPYSAGSLCSTVLDLITWTRALHSGRVVSKASLAQMTTPEKLSDGKPLTYGFGLGVSPLDGHRGIAHGGGIKGFVTHLAHYPDDSLTVVVLMNSESNDPERTERRIARKVLGIPEPKPKDLAVSEEHVGQLAGTYVQGENRVRVFTEKGSVMFVTPGDKPDRLLHQGGAVFIPANDPELRATFTPTGKLAQRLLISKNGRILFNGTRAP